MSRDEIIMLSEKAMFIKALEAALQTDKDSGVDSICYRMDPDAQDEIITVIFKGGGTKQILATGNSNGDNAKKIIGVVYRK